MGIIAFIKALAFISSIIAKVIAFPFVVLLKLLKLLRLGMCNVKQGLINARQTHKQKKEKNKNAKKKKVKKTKKTRPQRQWKVLSKVKSGLKGKNSFPVRVLRKFYYGSSYIIKKIYWGTRGICQKVYWRCFTVFQKVYWKCHTLFQKIYWKTRTITQKIYWGCYGIYQKVYWVTRGTTSKIYWKYYVVSRKVYANITKNAYVDLYFIFLRGQLSRTTDRIKCVKIVGVKEYVKAHAKNSLYQIVEEGTYRKVCIPEYFEKSEEKIEQFLSPDIYVAQIADADLIGGSNVIIANNTLLNDAAAYDKKHRIDIRYSAIKKVFNGVALIEDIDEVEQIVKGINLVGAASFNYYHLIVEILSRLPFVDMREEYEQYPILVDEIVLTIPQFKMALERINLKQHPVIEIKKGKKYHVNELVLPSSNVWMPTNLYSRYDIRVDDFLISDTVLHTIRDRIGVWEEQEPWRKIFISRKNTQAVRLQNEKEIRSIFEENGFEIIYTEEMTFQQQIECFGQAKCVVATSGAALTNTIFCQKNAIIGCIIPSYHRFYMYSTIAYLLGLKPLFLDAEIVDETPYAAADTFIMDEDYVRRYIKRLEEIL